MGKRRRLKPPENSVSTVKTSSSSQPARLTAVEVDNSSSISSSKRVTRAQAKQTAEEEIVPTPSQQEEDEELLVLQDHGVRRLNNLSREKAYEILRKRSFVRLKRLDENGSRTETPPDQSGEDSTENEGNVQRQDPSQSSLARDSSIPDPVEVAASVLQDPHPMEQRTGNRRSTRLKKPVRNEVENQTDLRRLRTFNNNLLPDRNIFPSPLDSATVKREKLGRVNTSVVHMFGLIFGHAQETEKALLPCYDRVEKVFEFFDNSGLSAVWAEEDGKKFGREYRQLCVSALYKFGLLISNRHAGQGSNPFVQRASNFFEYCLVHLGWNLDKKMDSYMKEYKHPDYPPASLSALICFQKYHCDDKTLFRQHQLSLINRILKAASEVKNYQYIKKVWEEVGNAVLIRVKDRSPACRQLALKILSHFLVIDEAKDNCHNVIKYYTRFDPSEEVRRLGTKLMGEKTKIKLRFFYDQAFDKSEGVRVETFNAMGVVESEGRGGNEGDQTTLVRAMDEITADKLCKVIAWGTLYSGKKCSNILKSEILPKWLELSCRGDLVKFLSNIDAYQHMKAVIKIMDAMLTTGEQERFVEEIDLNFLPLLKARILARDYKPVTLEAFVAWLGLCKASVAVESIRERVIPEVFEMLQIVGALHEITFQEHKEAEREKRDEDVTPVFCLVIALEISNRFVDWEEGNRRKFVELLKNILLDPLLDDRIIVIQAIHTLHLFVDKPTFEDTMMAVLQDVFDVKSGSRLSRSAREFRRSPSESPAIVSMSEADAEDGEDELFEEETPKPPPPPPPVVPKTKYEFTKMRAQLCDLGLKRLKLQKKKDELIDKKLFIDAIPINNELLQTQQEEKDLKDELERQEELAKQAALTQSAEADSKRFSSLSIPTNQAPADEVVENVEITTENDDEDSAMDSEDGGDIKSGIITTVEEGLAKGIFMINAYLDLCPQMCPFVRNIYESYVAGFMSEDDVNLKLSVLQFLTRIATIDERERRKVFCVMIQFMTADVQVELRNVAFQSIVDLIVCYDYKDFCLKEEEKGEGEEIHPYINNMTRFIKKFLPPNQVVGYVDCTPETIKKLTLEVLTNQFPGDTDSLSATELNILNLTKNIGLIKLFVMGRLREATILSKILCLWLDQDYFGTAVLSGLEHVLKLYKTFEWWGPNSHVDLGVDEIEGEVVNEEFRRSGMMRVLGLAVGQAVVSLCEGLEIGPGKGELLGKFIYYFLDYLDSDDQPLMRTIVLTILNPILSHPSSSCNSLLVKCASKIPIKSPISAAQIMARVNEVFRALIDIPRTTSVKILRRKLVWFVAKFKRDFGNDIAEGNDWILGADVGSNTGEDAEENELDDDGHSQGSEEGNPSSGVGGGASSDDEEDES